MMVRFLLDKWPLFVGLFLQKQSGNLSTSFSSSSPRKFSSNFSSIHRKSWAIHRAMYRAMYPVLHRVINSLVIFSNSSSNLFSIASSNSSSTLLSLRTVHCLYMPLFVETEWWINGWNVFLLGEGTEKVGARERERTRAGARARERERQIKREADRERGR